MNSSRGWTVRKKVVTPKNIYVRRLANGRFSVGEYIRGKWYNVVDPFRGDDAVAIGTMLHLILHFENKEGRPVALVSYGGGEARDALAKLLKRE